MNKINVKILKLFTPDELSSINSALNFHGSAKGILDHLKLDAPEEEDLQFQYIKEFLKIYGLPKFEEFIDEEVTEKFSIRVKPRVSTTLPKIRIDDDETQRVRTKFKKPVTEPVKTTPEPSTNTPIEQPNPVENIEEKNQVVDITSISDSEETPASTSKVYERDENGFLGTPTDDWDGKTERRSGEERREKNDRRKSIELIFSNQRYGKDRRSGEDRRKK